MNELDLITDWPERAAQANYCARTLAKRCGVSLRTLERFFQEHMHICPHCWLRDKRLARVPELRAQGFTVKEMAEKLGYRNQHHFAREFKKSSGCCPSECRKGGGAARSG